MSARCMQSRNLAESRHSLILCGSPAGAYLATFASTASNNPAAPSAPFAQLAASSAQAQLPWGLAALPQVAEPVVWGAKQAPLSRAHTGGLSSVSTQQTSLFAELLGANINPAGSAAAPMRVSSSPSHTSIYNYTYTEYRVQK